MNIHEWPIMEIGKTKFFGYVVAIGVSANSEFSEYIPYVEFWHNDIATRYRLPDNKKIRKELADCVAANITQIDIDQNNIYTKVYVTREFGGGYRMEWA